jgi:uncharacterized protein
VNPDDLVAIDFHTHAEEPCNHRRDDGYNEFQAGMAAYFRNPAGAEGMLPTVPQTAAYFRERRIGAVIFPVDAERETGFRRYSNEEVAQIAAENSDILIPFASIDPAKGKAGAREARRLVRDFGVRGFKFHPTMQGFFPNDRMAYPIYEAIAEEGAIALFHTGQTGVGSGMRGGMGMRLKFSNPIHVDDVAVDFPDMPIVLAHPSFPWTGEGLAVAQQSPTSTSTCRAGRRNTSRRSSCSTRTRSCARRCSSDRTGPRSRPTAGSRISRRSRSATRSGP